MRTTLCYLIKDKKILLAEKQRGFGKGKLNGVGGKIEKGETPEQAMIRETQEEIFVTPTNFEKVAEVEFDEFYKGQKENNYLYVYFAYERQGEPKQSEEMNPSWIEIDKIPYDRMFPDDPHWLPLVLNGKKIKGYFEFDENWNLLSKSIKQLKTLKK